MDNNRFIVRILVIILAVGLFIFLLGFIFNSSIVIVKTNRDAQMVLSSDKHQYKKENTRSGFFFVRPGTYSISVRDTKDNQSFATVKAGLFRKRTVQMPIHDQLKHYMISESALQDVQKISDDTFMGINTVTSRMQIIKNGITQDFQDSNQSDGVGLSRFIKLSGNYYLCVGDGFAQLFDTSTMTFKNIPGIEADEYTVSPNADQTSFWVIANGEAKLFEPPYKRSSRTISIESSDGQALATTKNLVLSYSSLTTVKEPESEAESTRDKPYFFNTSDWEKKSIKDDIQSAQISNDGNYIAYIRSSDMFLVIYDVAKNKVTQLVAQPDLPTIYWRDNVLYYTRSEGVWSYRVSDQYSRLVAQLDDAATSMSFGSRLFATTYPDEANAKVYSIGGNEDQALLSDLNRHFPSEHTDYRISYSYFDKPIVLVELRVPRNGDSPGRIQLYQQRLAEAKQSALKNITSAGVDPNSVTLTFIEGSP